MSTRGSIGFRLDNTDMLSYNHCDSYPEGLGASFVEQVATLIQIPNLKQSVRSIRCVSERNKPSKEDIDFFASKANLNVGNQSTDDWYCLLRNYQGDLVAMVRDRIMLRGNSFIEDSIFCEYAYIFNLDSNMAEFYQGFQKSIGNGRYASRENDGYFGCSLVAEFPANQIPSNWMELAYPKTNE